MVLTLLMFEKRKEKGDAGTSVTLKKTKKQTSKEKPLYALNPKTHRGCAETIKTHPRENIIIIALHHNQNRRENGNS